MVSGAQGMGGGPQLPPTIRETGTQAFVEVTKKYVLGMIADSMREVIPFTQREYNELFKYQSEASRPTLHGMLQVRASGPQAYGEKDDSWQQVYKSLVNDLPENVRGWLEWELRQPIGERDPDFVGVNNLLMAAAKLISWLSNVAPPVQPNTQAAHNLAQNIKLPYAALGNVLLQSQTVLSKAEGWINAMGSNAVSHDKLSNLLNELRGSLSFLEDLKSLMKGGLSSKTQAKFMQAAFELNRLSTTVKNSPLGDDLKILSTQLQSLARITEAWSVQTEPSPLSIGIAIATIGLAFGGTDYQSTVEQLLGGIIGLVDSGTQGELKELQTLYNDLAKLLNG